MTDLPPEDVQSYPRPPRLEPVPQRVRVVVAGEVIVDTGAAWRVCETHHPPTYYLPLEGLLAEALRPAGGGSLCEWKGRAVYFDLDWRGVRVPRAGWSYPDPTPAFAPIRGHVALYARALEAAWVGEAPVSPQPGGFYGGWVTPNLRGRIKGAPGTEWW